MITPLKTPERSGIAPTARASPPSSRTRTALPTFFPRGNKRESERPWLRVRKTSASPKQKAR